VPGHLISQPTKENHIMTTFADLLTPLGVDIPEGLIADAEVPVLTGPQRQGDVGIFPRAKLGKAEQAGALPVPAVGIAVVRGESTTGSNSHILQADGACTWTPAQARTGSVLLGVLHVPNGATAFLTHTDEHGCNAMGPGTYRITGKREMADEIRRVAD
jgi:hypothetical protein